MTTHNETYKHTETQATAQKHKQPHRNTPASFKKMIRSWLGILLNNNYHYHFGRHTKEFGDNPRQNILYGIQKNHEYRDCCAF